MSRVGRAVRGPCLCRRIPLLLRSNLYFEFAWKPCATCQIQKPRTRCQKTRGSSSHVNGSTDSTSNHTRNKLNIGLDALASVAGGWDGRPSRIASDILDAVADLPMTSGAPRGSQMRGM
jgi:hypothetical protein